jgi:hypothetical protein
MSTAQERATRFRALHAPGQLLLLANAGRRRARA